MIGDIIKLKGISFEEINTSVPERLILLGYRGSIAHGTYVLNSDPNSIDDKDIMGVFVAPKEYYLGFNRNETYEKKLREWDMIFYEVRKFIHLLIKSNPNVLMMLWLPEKYYIYSDSVGWALVLNKEIFISKQIYHSFTGYAYGQLHRMENWKFEGYMGGKRKALVEKFGYDTKNASHLIRLLRMGIEFLIEGKLNVEREDATELIDIKMGKWSLEKVKQESSLLFEQARESYIKSSLPNEPDRKKAEQLCINIISCYHKFPFDGWEWK